MKHPIIMLILSIFYLSVNAQDFPSGTNAIHKDSAIISAWAVSVEVYRGYIKISDTSFTYTEGEISSNRAWSGSEQNAIGPANGQFVSLGDGGYAILQFDKPISNGPGHDFVVFENAMFSPPNQTLTSFVELAFVEVSSDGVNYERFPSVSEMQFQTQISSFQSVEWTKYHNFAGIYPVFYGVPFDLDDIPGEIVDKNNITHVKIIDAIGCINHEFATHDSEGNIVNCAWPTPFHTGGFDLDAVGVINSVNNIKDVANTRVHIYPNPAVDFVNIDCLMDYKVHIYNSIGQAMKFNIKQNRIDLSGFKSGIYYLNIMCNDKIFTEKLIILEN